MIDTVLVTVAILAGVVALAGVPLRCWQFATGRFYPYIPQHALAQASFNLFSVLFLVPSALAWAYALYVGWVEFNCTGTCAQTGVGTALALGLLGCAYILLEGFLLTARRRKQSAASEP
jgi:hypothetical protein